MKMWGSSTIWCRVYVHMILSYRVTECWQCSTLFKSPCTWLDENCTICTVSWLIGMKLWGSSTIWCRVYVHMILSYRVTECWQCSIPFESPCTWLDENCTICTVSWLIGMKREVITVLNEDRSLQWSPAIIQDKPQTQCCCRPVYTPV